MDALKALARFSDDLFAEKVGEAFPALTALVRCEHAPAEVSRVLGEVFTAKIGPLVIGSLGKVDEGDEGDEGVRYVSRVFIHKNKSHVVKAHLSSSLVKHKQQVLPALLLMARGLKLN